LTNNILGTKVIVYLMRTSKRFSSWNFSMPACCCICKEGKTCNSGF